MVVAITPRQWTGLVKTLGIADAVSALEARLGVSFARDEGARFAHRANLVPLFPAAIALRKSADLEAEFEANGVCWFYYRTLSESLTDEPRLFSAVQHPAAPISRRALRREFQVRIAGRRYRLPALANIPMKCWPNVSASDRAKSAACTTQASSVRWLRAGRILSNLNTALRAFQGLAKSEFGRGTGGIGAHSRRTPAR